MNPLMAGKETKAEGSRWPFGPKNYAFLGAALVSIIIGYIALASGSITLAPILLVLGYCVLFPIGIILRGKPDEEVREGKV